MWKRYNPPSDYDMFIAIGPHRLNSLREDFYNQAKKKGYNLPAFISSSARVPSDFKYGDNNWVDNASNAHPFVVLGKNNVIINSNLGHHTKIGNHCFISSAIIGGKVTIEDNEQNQHHKRLFCLRIYPSKDCRAMPSLYFVKEGYMLPTHLEKLTWDDIDLVNNRFWSVKYLGRFSIPMSNLLKQEIRIHNSNRDEDDLLFKQRDELNSFIQDLTVDLNETPIVLKKFNALFVELPFSYRKSVILPKN